MEVAYCLNKGEISDVFACLLGDKAFTFFVLPAIAFGLLIIWLLLRVQNRQEGKALADMAELAALMKPRLPAYASADHAGAVFAFANKEYFQLMLGVVGKSLAAEGYVLTDDPQQRIPLSPESSRRIARAVFIAREQHLAPGQPSSVLMERADDAMENGYAMQWLETLILSSESTGWFIAPGEKKPAGTPENLTDWQKNAYPLRQVTVKIFASERWLLTRDLVRCLSDIAAIVREQPFPEDAEGTQSTGNSLTSDMQYSIQWRICFQPPGFFPDAAGTHIPPSLHVDDSVTVGSPEHELTLFVQGTRHTSPGYLADFMAVAGKRIAAGETRGARYDDDSGFAFFVNSRLTSRVPRDVHDEAKEATLE